MTYREVRVFEVREALRLCLRARGSAPSSAWRSCTARPYVATDGGRALRLVRDGGEGQPTDEFIGQMLRRCDRTAAKATERRAGG